jgi:hypothetical protein
MDEFQPDLTDQSIRERLNKTFSRYDYVGITNPLDEEFTWTVGLERNEITNMSQADPMNEERMAQTSRGSFLPGEGIMHNQTKVTRYTLKPGEKRMMIGEAAYVIVPRLYNALCRKTYGTSKSGLAHLRNPNTQSKHIKEIVTGPVIDNVSDAMQTFVNDKMSEIENGGFTDVQTAPTKAVKGGDKVK